MKHIKLFEQYSDDDTFDAFARSIFGYGEHKKEHYSYNNEEDVNWVFEAIEGQIWSRMVSKRLSELQEEEPSEDLLKKIEQDIEFIKSTHGVSFVNGGIELEEVSKTEFIKAYITYSNNHKQA